MVALRVNSIAPAESRRGSWRRLIACGLVAGAIINAIEWIAHRVWLDARWNAAFAALGKTPSFWATFVVANFGVGIVALWAYHWLSGFYGGGISTAIRTAIGMWVVFWIVPIAGLQPFGIFPNYLLALVIVVGIADAAMGILPALWLFDYWSGSQARMAE